MNRMAGPEAWAAMKACFVFMSSPPIEQKKPRLCAEPQPPPSAACYPGECCASSAASAFCAAAEPAASSSSRQVFNCVGVTPGSAATLLCVAPGSDSRATDCSLYSGRKPPPRLLCHPVPPGRYLIYRLVRDPGATSNRTKRQKFRTRVNFSSKDPPVNVSATYLGSLRIEQRP